MTSFQRMDRIRRGGTVMRYHTHRMQNRPNNAAHQWGVAALLIEIYREAYDKPEYDWPQLPANDLLTFALFHDVAEYDTGDSPAWVKRAHPAVKMGLDSAEAAAIEAIGLGQLLPKYNGFTEEERALVKACDDLEHLWTCLEERRAGNTDVDVMFHRGWRGIKAGWEADCKDYKWFKPAFEMLMCIASEYDYLDEDASHRVGRMVEAGEDYFSQMGDTRHVKDLR